MLKNPTTASEPFAAEDSNSSEALQTTRNGQLGQILFCEGCCCGRVDRNMPAFPREMIKREWKARKLNPSIQLTISGCLGPCDLPNVACLLSASGQMTWLGNLSDLSEYQSLIEWAVSCQEEGAYKPLPHLLQQRVFERFKCDSASPHIS